MKPNAVLHNGKLYASTNRGAHKQTVFALMAKNGGHLLVNDEANGIMIVRTCALIFWIDEHASAAYEALSANVSEKALYNVLEV